jgi:uncharacterized protein YdeI (YjbR/CyaY-like superfamily)
MTNPEVDDYFETATQWPAELQQVRKLLAGTTLVEDYKWRQPCYTHEGANVLILGTFKDGCRVTFFKGALLEDPKGLLEPVGENSNAGRVLKYTDVDQIDEKALLGFIQQAIAVEDAGLSVEPAEREEPDLPEELLAAFDDVDGLRDAWEALTPGRQRGYVYFFADAKKSETRRARIDKNVEKIFDGKGIHDR